MISKLRVCRSCGNPFEMTGSVRICPNCMEKPKFQRKYNDVNLPIYQEWKKKEKEGIRTMITCPICGIEIEVTSFSFAAYRTAYNSNFEIPCNNCRDFK